MAHAPIVLRYLSTNNVHYGHSISKLAVPLGESTIMLLHLGELLQGHWDGLAVVENVRTLYYRFLAAFSQGLRETHR
jgi:hypothetical protein